MKPRGQIAVDEIAAVIATLLGALETNARPKNRAEEAAKVKARRARSLAEASN